jgi:hypothetical protein
MSILLDIPAQHKTRKTAINKAFLSFIINYITLNQIHPTMIKQFLFALFALNFFGFATEIKHKQPKIKKTSFKMPRRKYVRNETCHGRVVNFYAMQKVQPIPQNIIIEKQQVKLKEAEEKLLQLQCADQLASIHKNANEELSIETIKNKFFEFNPASIQSTK